MKVAILENGKSGCCLCGAELYFPQSSAVSGISPPLIGEYFVCEPCFERETKPKSPT